MPNQKNLKWLRGIFRAVTTERDLTFEITRNTDTSGSSDKFIYCCRNQDNRLMFDRKIDIDTAMLVVNSWKGEVITKETP